MELGRQVGEVTQLTRQRSAVSILLLMELGRQALILALKPKGIIVSILLLMELGRQVWPAALSFFI